MVSGEGVGGGGGGMRGGLVRVARGAGAQGCRRIGIAPEVGVHDIDIGVGGGLALVLEGVVHVVRMSG